MYNIRYLKENNKLVFLILLFVSGFAGAFTFLKYGVFSNAQTMNFLLIGINLGKFNITKIFYYMIPIFFYFLGIIISEIAIDYLGKKYNILWKVICISVEIICIFILGFLVDEYLKIFSPILISFICAMQINTFREIHGLRVSTTMCTNILRIVSIGFFYGFKKTKKIKNVKEKTISLLYMLIMFIIGAFFCSFLLKYFKNNKCILFNLIPLTYLFIFYMKKLTKGDINYKNNDLK